MFMIPPSIMLVRLELCLRWPGQRAAMFSGPGTRTDCCSGFPSFGRARENCGHPFWPLSTYNSTHSSTHHGTRVRTSTYSSAYHGNQQQKGDDLLWISCAFLAFDASHVAVFAAGMLPACLCCWARREYARVLAVVVHG